MDTFADTANVDYRISFADQENKLPFSVIGLQKTNGSLPFPFSLSSVFVYVYIETAAYK
jgi:hypothetical protein